MVSKVVINLLIQPANWAVRNSRVGYAYILVGKLPDFAETLHHEALAELVADQSNSLLLKCIKHPHNKDYFCFSLRGARVWYNTDLTVFTSSCVHDCTNCVKTALSEQKQGALKISVSVVAPEMQYNRSKSISHTFFTLLPTKGGVAG